MLNVVMELGSANAIEMAVERNVNCLCFRNDRRPRAGIWAG